MTRKHRSHARHTRGFTLVETLAAIALITISIVAPMALTVQSLEAAYYARDQITASNLAQEGIEAVRSIRDGNILAIAEGSNSTTLFLGIPINAPFIIDARQTLPSKVITQCSSSPCSAQQATLQFNAISQLYGYNGSSLCPNPGSGWTCTNFMRYASSSVVWSDSNGNAQEIRVAVTVSWKTSAYKSEQIQLSENLYNWATTGSAS